jgi:hypothetical protein
MDPSRKFTHSTDAVHAAGPAQFHKIHPSAQELEPFDVEDEIGFSWDVFVHSRDEGRNDDVTGDMNAFCTGFAVIPPSGFHFVIEPHPDLHRYGYTLLAPVRIYSTASSEDEIKLNLYKFKDCDDLELPHAVGRMFLAMNTTANVNINRVAKAPISQPSKKRGVHSASVYEEPVQSYTQPVAVPNNARRSRQGGLA